MADTNKLKEELRLKQKAIDSLNNEKASLNNQLSKLTKGIRVRDLIGSG
jgi:response regulator of citrate/malate metabolism